MFLIKSNIFFEELALSWLFSLEMDTMTRDQILDEVLCSSHRANKIGKRMNPTILPVILGKLLSRLDSINLMKRPVSKKADSDFKSFKLRLKLTLFRILFTVKRFCKYKHIFAYNMSFHLKYNYVSKLLLYGGPIDMLMQDRWIFSCEPD